MHVETLISELAEVAVELGVRDAEIIISLQVQLYNSTNLTFKQRILAVQILKRHIVKLSEHLGVSLSIINAMLETPTYQYPVRNLVEHRSVTVIDDAEFTRKIKIQFPYDEYLVRMLRVSRPALGRADWDAGSASWSIPLSENSINFVSNIFNNGFTYDNEIQNYINQRADIIKNLETHAPTLIKCGDQYTLSNVSKYVPAFSTTDVVHAIFQARKYGITTWTEQVATDLTASVTNEHIKKFLMSRPGDPFKLNCLTESMEDLLDIVKQLSPCMIILPGGSEFDKLKRAHTFLKEAEIANDDISVLFRLPNDTHSEFNNYVKTNKLNSAINSDTKVVIISNKIPKPVLKSNIYFNSVINMGFMSGHYSIRDIEHHNFIYFSEQSIQRK